jgi:TM2 domain-containing membrane protein YozV
MRINFKALLLSAFVLPGLGQIIKGDKVKGAILICLVNVFLLAAVFLVLQTIGPLLAAKLDGTANTLNILEILKTKSPAARWLLAGFCGIWLYAAVDAARS